MFTAVSFCIELPADTPAVKKLSQAIKTPLHTVTARFERCRTAAPERLNYREPPPRIQIVRSQAPVPSSLARLLRQHIQYHVPVPRNLHGRKLQKKAIFFLYQAPVGTVSL